MPTCPSTAGLRHLERRGDPGQSRPVAEAARLGCIVATDAITPIGGVDAATARRRALTPDQRDHERQLAIYDQNAQSFRALNQIWWQIPVISMTLTGGLWFGVSKADSPFFRIGLLLMAGLGNVVLIAVAARLRYIMGAYLSWLEAFDTSGFVAARGDGPGDRVWVKAQAVRWAFQIMFGFAAIVSFGLIVPVGREAHWFQPSSDRSVAFYDRSAEDLVDRYEAVEFAKAHPYLVSTLTGKPKKRVLDVGAGTGRDAAAMADLGHAVTAVEPSDRMRGLARTLHGVMPIAWIDASLPKLAAPALNNKSFDLIVLSAVWMHVHPSARRSALERLSNLLADGGEIYMTLRVGPGDPGRAMYPVSAEELEHLAPLAGLTYRQIAEAPDLLGRADLRWKTVVLARPKPD